MCVTQSNTVENIPTALVLKKNTHWHWADKLFWLNFQLEQGVVWPQQVLEEQVIVSKWRSHSFCVRACGVWARPVSGFLFRIYLWWSVWLSEHSCQSWLEVCSHSHRSTRKHVRDLIGFALSHGAQTPYLDNICVISQVSFTVTAVVGLHGLSPSLFSDIKSVISNHTHSESLWSSA